MSSEIRLRSEWLSLLKGEFEQPYMSRLSAFLRAEKAAGKTIYPPAGQFLRRSRRRRRGGESGGVGAGSLPVRARLTA